jgi:hypothetical protein
MPGLFVHKAVRDTLAVPLPNLRLLLPVGAKGLSMANNEAEKSRPNIVWNAVRELDHDYRDEVGKKEKVHSYMCRRCRIELLLRQVTNQLGTPQD